MVSCGGRISRAPISPDAMNPMTLPRNHHVTTILIRYVHERNGHCGVEQVLSLLREQFWVIIGRAAVKEAIGRCISCKKRIYVGMSMFGKFMVSFDVESLFTNIPLEECIDLAVNYISEGNPDLKLSESELRSLFTVATAQTHFLFNGSFYDQIDGVAMGSPLAPVLANLLMRHHEKLWLENFQGSEILFYRRYVDDTFCLFHLEHDAITFFDYINSRHPKISFTMEREAYHKLPFLDVLVNNNNDPNSPLTSVYHKKTFTGLLTHYLSFTPYSYKVGLIRNLVDRAYKINNTWLGLHEDITKLMDILKRIFSLPM